VNPPISRPAFVELIAGVGEHLAGNWEIIPNPDDWPMGAHLVDHDLHADLYFNHHEGKIHVSSDLPKDAKGEIPYVEGYGQLGKRMPSINTSFNKSPEQIAKDIERRLMPEYMDILMKALSRIASSDAYHSKTEGFAGQIAKLVGVENKPQIVKHHLLQLEKMGMIKINMAQGVIQAYKTTFNTIIEMLKFRIINAIFATHLFNE